MILLNVEKYKKFNTQMNKANHERRVALKLKTQKQQSCFF